MQIQTQREGGENVGKEQSLYNAGMRSKNAVITLSLFCEMIYKTVKECGD